MGTNGETIRIYLTRSQTSDLVRDVLSDSVPSRRDALIYAMGLVGRQFEADLRVSIVRSSCTVSDGKRCDCGAEIIVR